MCAYGEPVQDSIPATHLMLGDPGRDRPVLQRRSIMQEDTNVRAVAASTALKSY